MMILMLLLQAFIFANIVNAAKPKKAELRRHRNNLEQFLGQLNLGDFEVSDITFYPRKYNLYKDLTPFQYGFITKLPYGSQLKTIRTAIGSKNTSWDCLLNDSSRLLSQRDLNGICKSEGKESSCLQAGSNHKHPRWAVCFKRKPQRGKPKQQVSTGVQLEKMELAREVMVEQAEFKKEHDKRISDVLNLGSAQWGMEKKESFIHQMIFLEEKLGSKFKAARELASTAGGKFEKYLNLINTYDFDNHRILNSFGKLNRIERAEQLNTSQVAYLKCNKTCIVKLSRILT